MSDVDEWMAKYLSYVDRGVAMIPYARAKIWREFFLSPVAVIRKDNVGIGQRFMDLYAMTGVVFVILCLMYVPMLIVMSLLSGGTGLIMVGAFMVAMLVLLLISPIFSFLYSLLELLIAKLLGGVGGMQANFNAAVLPNLALFVVQLPLTVLTIPLVWLSMVPIISLCASCIQMPLSIVMMLLGLYSLYLKYLGFKEVHKLSSARAAGVVILPIVLIVVAVVLLVVLMYAAIIAWLMSISAATAAAGAGLPN